MNAQILSMLTELDVLNRLADLESKKETIHFAKHVFPLQFNLHNVFTSSVDSRETTYMFKDYALRESEIATVKDRKLPKRLRGPIIEFLQQIRRNHARLSYVELLKHHCPVPASPDSGSPTKMASEQAQVFLFCKSVVSHLIRPANFGVENWRVLLKHLRAFVMLRKFENMNLESVLLGIKVGRSMRATKTDVVDYRYSVAGPAQTRRTFVKDGL
jgi:telomerase reverse transcriptase